MSGDAWVSGDAEVYGNARVYGNAEVSGDAKVSGDAWVSGDAAVSGNARVYGNARVSLKRAYTKGNFIHSSDNTIETTVINQSNEDGFDNGIDYANLLVVGDYEISKIDEPAKPTETIQIEGKSYTLDEIKKALEKGK